MSVLRRLFGIPRGEHSDAEGIPAAPDDDTSTQHAASAADSHATRTGGVVAEMDACNAAGRYPEALALAGRALSAAPGDPQLLLARASTLFAWGRLREARDAFLALAARGFRHEQLHLQLGWSHLYTGDAVAAEAWMRRAVVAHPDLGEAHFGLALALLELQRFDEAGAACRRALEIAPENTSYLICLGLAKLDLKDAVGAEEDFRRAIAMDPERVIGWANLAAALDVQHRHDDLLEVLWQVERLRGAGDDDIDSFVDIASRLKDEGRVEESLAVLEANLAGRPSAMGHGKYALCLLTAGRMTEGWHHYEFRWLTEPLIAHRAKTPSPVWAGQDLRGKTILLRTEQGFGDRIQFLRYAPYVKRLGATVLLPRFSDLADAFDGVDHVFDPDAPTPDFDYSIPLMSLPRVFGTELDSIPAPIPYLRLKPDRSKPWSLRLSRDGGLKVGLVWAGSPAHVLDRERSIPLGTLMPVLALAGTRFYSLQKGPASTQLESLSSEVELTDLGKDLGDFADTAAVIDQLDLVLCVDTAVAHLAGALGKPVWLMLPRPADFRWLQDREDSPWYPTMRLFRQQRAGDWDEVVERVKLALQKRLQGDAAERMPHAIGDLPRPPVLVPVCRPGLPAGHRPGLSAAAETRAGILQYLPDDPEVGASIAWYGEYLQPQIDLLEKLIRPGSTVMEVGAGIGAHAAFLAAATGPAGHLFLYEPRPIVRRILRQNLAVNRVTGGTVMRRALGSPARPCATSGGGPPAGAVGGCTTEGGIVTETLDELQMETLDWLKINDGETALAVLGGATDALWRLRPRLFLDARGESVFAVLAGRARDFGYRCWRMDTPLFNPRNFNRRDDDIFDGRAIPALIAIPEEVEVDIAADGCIELS